MIDDISEKRLYSVYLRMQPPLKILVSMSQFCSLQLFIYAKFDTSQFYIKMKSFKLDQSCFTSVFYVKCSFRDSQKRCFLSIEKLNNFLFVLKTQRKVRSQNNSFDAEGQTAEEQVGMIQQVQSTITFQIYCPLNQKLKIHSPGEMSSVSLSELQFKSTPIQQFKVIKVKLKYKIHIYRISTLKLLILQNF